MAHLNGELFHSSKLKQISVPCPLCNSFESQVYERYGEELQYAYARCKECSFIYQNPRFEYNEEFLKWAYSHYGDEFMDSKNEAEALKEQLKAGDGYFSFKKDLMDGFFDHAYRLLDIGAACGQFVYYCNGKKCVAAGLETSERQVNFGKHELGLEMHLGTTAEVVGKIGAFDAVHIAHTLEHVPYPKQTLSEIIELTRPGGIVFVEVPNVYSAHNFSNHIQNKYKLKKNTWGKGDFPEHLVEFSPKTLKRIMQDMGLKIEYFQVHSRSALRKSTLRKKLDLNFNRLLPIGNNLICIGRKGRSASRLN